MTKYGAIPTLAYKDAEGTIDFLTKALGFKAENVYHTETGQVMHAWTILARYRGNTRWR